MKNAVPKNDKKRRKQLTEDVAKLEREMEQKHREELEQLKLTLKESKIDSVAVDISNLVLENHPPRISKAQKRRVPAENELCVVPGPCSALTSCMAFGNLSACCFLRRGNEGFWIR